MTGHLLETCGGETLYEICERMIEQIANDEDFVKYYTEWKLDLDYDSNPEFRHWRPYGSRFER